MLKGRKNALGALVGNRVTALVLQLIVPEKKVLNEGTDGNPMPITLKSEQRTANKGNFGSSSDTGPVDNLRRKCFHFFSGTADPAFARIVQSQF